MQGPALEEQNLRRVRRQPAVRLVVVVRSLAALRDDHARNELANLDWGKAYVAGGNDDTAADGVDHCAYLELLNWCKGDPELLRVFVEERGPCRRAPRTEHPRYLIVSVGARVEQPPCCVADPGASLCHHVLQQLRLFEQQRVRDRVKLHLEPLIVPVDEVLRDPARRRVAHLHHIAQHHEEAPDAVELGQHQQVRVPRRKLVHPPMVEEM